MTEPNENRDKDLPTIDLATMTQLVERARAGDREAQNEICRNVQSQLNLIAKGRLDQKLRSRVNPSDIVQLTMTRMVNGFVDFRGTTSNEFYAWLNTIMQNEISASRRDMHRAKRDISRETPLENSSRAVDFAAETSSPQSAILRNEQLLRFMSVIERLPIDYAEVIRLRSLEELPFNEVAEKMGRSANSVSKLWNRAMIKLSEELEGLDESIS